MVGNKIVFTGIREFSTRYSDKILKRIEKRILGKIAAFAKKDTKQNIRVALKRRTGKLLKSIKYKGLKGNAYMLFAGRSDGYYAIMHEKGTKARGPRGEKYLTFQIGGQWIKKKSVTALRPVWFAKNAITEIERGRHKSEIDMLLQKIFDELERKPNGF